MAVDLPTSKALRNKLDDDGDYSEWPSSLFIPQKSYPPNLVQMHCVEDAEWQKCRLSMKGIATHKKLHTLVLWWITQRNKARNSTVTRLERVALATATEVQIGNYLGALRRGGQLNDDNQVRRYI